MAALYQKAKEIYEAGWKNNDLEIVLRGVDGFLEENGNGFDLASFSVKPCKNFTHGNRFGKISRLVDVASFQVCDMVGQKLQGMAHSKG